MKLERAEDNYGCGSGITIFDSDTFRVVRWKHGSGGVSTTIECRLINFLELRFDGSPAIDSDEVCMEQFKCGEILQMIAAQKEISFAEGKQSKIAEIRKCLSI